MLTARSRRDCEIFFKGSMDGLRTCRTEIDGIAMIPVSSSSPHPSSSPSSPSGSSPGSCIHHRVSKMDTLAGVAIKYGVEVADIKRLNGLVTDLQMFAHKSLQIPLPGRHPPSHSLSNGSVDDSDYSPRYRPCNEVFDLIVSFNLDSPRKVSPAMSRLQGYYGLTLGKKEHVLEGEDKAATKTGRRCRDDESDVDSPSYYRPPSRHRKTRSLVTGFTVENCADSAGLEGTDNGETERSVRRRQKAEGGPFMRNPEPLLNEDEGVSPVKAGRGISPRPKLGSRIGVDAVRTNGDILKAEAHASSVRKSSSTSCLLQDPDSYNTSMWPSRKWILKPEVLSKPIFDGFPKSIGVRRNKAALD